MQINPNIKRTAIFGNLKFPVREDYVTHFLENGLVKDEDEIWSNENYVNVIHRHWHGQGRNGCIFALLAARRADELGWKNYIVTEDIDAIEAGDLTTIVERQIQEAIDNPNCEILSLLFSRVITDEQLVRLIVYLLSLNNIFLEDEHVINDYITLSVRVPIQSRNILSWVMAFGPFSYFPQTRQSAITEVAIRVKPKPEIQFKRLSKDYDAAHLADLPVDYKDEVMEQTWENTLKRTRIILGGEPDHFSAAKTTFTLPNKLWTLFYKDFNR